MSQMNPGTETQALLLSMLQKMEINSASSSSSSFSAGNDRDGPQQQTGTEGGDGVAHGPSQNWGGARSDHAGSRSTTVGVPTNTNGHSPAPLDPLMQNCLQSTERWGGGREGSSGAAFGIAEQDEGLGTLTRHQTSCKETTGRKKKRETEWKTATWTDRIKQRWRDRYGTLGKKGSGRRSVKDERKKGDEKREEPQFHHLTWHRIMDRNGSDAPAVGKECTFQSPIREWPDEALPSQAEGSTEGSHVSPLSELEFNFSPTNLVEEIFMGREWSNFLSVGRSPPESPGTIDQSPTGDLTQLNQKNGQPERCMQRVPPEVRSVDSQGDFTSADISCTLDTDAMKPAEVLENSFQMRQAQLSRKRDHFSATRNSREPMRWFDGVGAGIAGRAKPGGGDSTASPLHASQDSTPPLLPRSALRSPAGRGQESPTSSETAIKKRKIVHGATEARHVRFAEQPEFLPDPEPFELDDSEDEEQPPVHAWIQSLKRKTKQKPRH